MWGCSDISRSEINTAISGDAYLKTNTNPWPDCGELVWVWYHTSQNHQYLLWYKVLSEKWIAQHQQYPIHLAARRHIVRNDFNKRVGEVGTHGILPKSLHHQYRGCADKLLQRRCSKPLTSHWNGLSLKMHLRSWGHSSPGRHLEQIAPSTQTSLLLRLRHMKQAVVTNERKTYLLGRRRWSASYFERWDEIRS